MIKKVDSKFNYLYTFKNIQCDYKFKVIDHVNIYDFYNTNGKRYMIFCNDLNPFKDYDQQASSDHICIDAYETLEEALQWCKDHSLISF